MIEWPKYAAFWLPLLIWLVGLPIGWLYYELRWARRNPVKRRAAVFRCTRCTRLYADQTGLPRIACPSCGSYNDAVLK